MRVLMSPHPSQVTGRPDGISRVVGAYGKYLPEFGVEIVPADAITYDLRAAHAGCTGGAVDVAHLHGIYPTANYKVVHKGEWETNGRVVDAARHAKVVTVPSPWVAEIFKRDMHFSPHVVGHGIDWGEWADHDQPNAGYILWNKNRRVDVCDPAPVTWLAEKYPKENFVTTFGTVNSPHNVRVIGPTPYATMKKYIQSAAVMLVTTKETFGISILEAMASGVPVLSVARGNAPYVVEHKVTGYLASNWADMADGLGYCLEHRDELGANAREAAKAFTWEKVCEKVAALYEQALVEEPATAAVIIPSYNYADNVGRAIESVTQQTYPLLKDIVVVDDGSDDDGETERVVKEWTSTDSRVKYLRQPNMGVAYARNHGIEMTDAKYITCLDADDKIEPGYLEACIPFLEADRALGIAYTGLYYIKPDGEEGLSGWPPRYHFDDFLPPTKLNQVPTCCVFRREMWRRLGGYRQRYAPQGAGEEDVEFWLRSGAAGWGAHKVTDEGLFIYSWQSGRVSGNSAHQETDWLAWHPWVRDNKHPLASRKTPDEASHPVRQYDEPTISVIIPVGPKHRDILVDALDSLEAQTFREWEAIVVNDSGKPLDLDAWPFARLVETEGEQGAGFARNRGIEVARAKLFVCLDADDFLQPDCLQTMYDVGADNPDAWIYTNVFILHPDGGLENYNTPDWSIGELWKNGVAAVTCLYSRQMWEAVGGFDEDNNREDWDFHLRLARAGYCGFKVAQPLFTYRHATGTRREDGSIKQEAQRLHELYSQEELEVMCKGCKSRGRSTRTVDPTANPMTPPENWQSKEALGWPEIEYVGNNQNTLVFKGRTRRKYRFGNNQFDRRGRVHPDDLRHLLRLQCFRQVGSSPATVARPVGAQPQLPPVARPVPQPAQAIPMAPAQLTPAPPPIPPSPIAVAKNNGKPVSVDELKYKHLKDDTFDFTREEWQMFLDQEEAKPKPRTSIVTLIRRKIKQSDPLRA